ncbi:thioesterase II family protein [Catenulispora pinisilvae]|uniref:thioesterase II family protein n=1 Tax=Catenulispora pinisilvae TaxID=2705253 RepID=UPI00189191B5|nr:thioesterase [Catenulispora pinisilvae]
MTRHRLYCFPHAGAGASFFASWRKLSAPDLDIVGIPLPGREKRFLEPPLESMAEVVETAALWIQEHQAAHPVDHVHLFGHSVGALLAFETSRRLAGTSLPLRSLFVSGASGPAGRQGFGAADLPDDEFIKRVADAVGYSHPAFGDPDLREMLLPPLRVDVTMHERYKPLSDEKLRIAVTALRGDKDLLIDTEDCEQWAEVTTADFELVLQQGGHMYLAENPGTLIDVVRSRIAAPRIAAL